MSDQGTKNPSPTTSPFQKEPPRPTINLFWEMDQTLHSRSAHSKPNQPEPPPPTMPHRNQFQLHPEPLRRPSRIQSNAIWTQESCRNVPEAHDAGGSKRRPPVTPGASPPGFRASPSSVIYENAVSVLTMGNGLPAMGSTKLADCRLQTMGGLHRTVQPGTQEDDQPADGKPEAKYLGQTPARHTLQL
ncbi:hypothetical protein ILUMI_24519 [Ignelater luminosus]|uniref:Uncharacterized protein n=1 Tax=Ignelater luminosus TaxID=2038154 RepID=A0A8K0CCE5_IGNLU|nr:hypothetical protein ILUMI_24519 [Ignelater luminosus]